MISYTERRVFPEPLLKAFRLSQRVVDLVDDVDESLRCHELARVVARVLCDNDYVVQVQDGVLQTGVNFEHSWLTMRCGSTAVILDPYVVGRVPQVQMIDVELRLASQYVSKGPRTDVDLGRVSSELDRIRLLL